MPESLHSSSYCFLFLLEGREEFEAVLARKGKGGGGSGSGGGMLDMERGGT